VVRWLSRFVSWVGRSRGLEKSFAENPAQWLIDFFGGRSSSTGVVVNERSALQSARVWASVRNVAEDLGSLPCHAYRRTAEGREEDPDFHLHPIFNEVANEEMDSLQYIESQQAHLMFSRNCYAEIVRNGRGQVVALWPLHPDRVRVVRVDGVLVYLVTLPDGHRDPATGLPYKALAREKVFHLKAMALDGVSGESSTGVHAEVIGLTVALERQAGFFLQNGAQPGGVFQTDKKLSDQAYARLLKSLEKRHGGIEKTNRAALLEEGLKWHSTGVPPRNAQHVESRRFQAEEIAAIYRQPAHMIGDLSRATFANIEHQGIEYVVYTIRPYAVRWEKGIKHQLMTPAERRTHYLEFKLDALLRGDSVSEAAALQVMRQNGIINADEWRRLKNMNPQPDGAGRVYLVNGNMVPVGRVLAAPAPGAAPAPPGDPDPDPGPGDDVVRALASVFEDAFARAMRKEQLAVRRAAKKPLAEFEDWARDFYATHAGVLGGVLEPSYRTLAVLVGAPPERAGAHARTAAERYCRRALTGLGDAVRAAGAGWADVAESLPARAPWGDARELATAEVEHAVAAVRKDSAASAA